MTRRSRALRWIAVTWLALAAAAATCLMLVAGETDAVLVSSTPRQEQAVSLSVAPDTTPVRVRPNGLEGAPVIGRASVVHMGRTLDELNGELVVHQRGRTIQRVVVSAGAWQAALQRGAVMRVVSLVLDTRPVCLVQRSIEVPTTGELELSGTWYEGPVLTVVDADTGDDLSNVDVFDVTHANPGSRMQPSLVQFALATNATSPISLERRAGQRRLLVKSPGYEWREIAAVLDVAGERRVELERAGTLRITCLRVPASGTPLVRLRRAMLDEGGQSGDRNRPVHAVDESRELLLTGERPTTVPASMGPAWRAQGVVEGLGPGRWTVRLEHGRSGDPLSIDYDVDVRPGEEVDLDIEYQARAAEVDAVDLKVLVLLPGGVDTEHVEVVLSANGTRSSELRSTATDPKDRVDRRPRDASVLWSLGPITPGEYVLLVRPLQYSRPLAVTGPADRFIEVVVPTPVRVSCQLADEGSSQALALSRVTWCPSRLVGVKGIRPQEAALSNDRRTATFQAPAEPINILFHLPDRSMWVERIEPSDQASMFRLSRRLTGSIALSLASDGVPIPVALDWWDGIVTEGPPGSRSTGVLRTMTTSEGSSGPVGLASRAQIDGLAAGICTLSFPSVRGFEPLAPLEVVVNAPGTAEVHLQLRPQY